MTAERITLEFSLAEVNQILAALGRESYADVFNVIGSIQAQAEAQLKQDEPGSEASPP